MMILSETTVKKRESSLKRDFSERILKKISPFFGFDYHDPPKQIPFSKCISSTKSPKGITLISKQKTQKYSNQQQKISQIYKWSKLIKERTKISEKLFNTYTQKWYFQNNPEQLEQVSPQERVSLFLEAYRPDLIAHRFVGACARYMGRLMHKGQEHLCCNIVLSICAFTEILTLLTSIQQFKQNYFTPIQSYLSQQMLFDSVTMQRIIENTLNHFWQFIFSFPKNLQYSIITYLIKQKFNYKAIAELILAILRSNESNLQILSQPQSLSVGTPLLISSESFPNQILSSMQHAYYSIPFERGTIKKKSISSSSTALQF